MTHRMLSKNSASSRAIPTNKLIQDLRDNPVIPMWTRNEKGMQGGVIEDQELIEKLNTDWLFARDFAINEAGALAEAGVHKQNTNRIIEPFQHIRVICTGTEWQNFFDLRDHPAAMPEIQVLARSIKESMDRSKPEMLNPGEWHLPFGDMIDEEALINRSYELLCGGRNWEVESKRDLIADDVALSRAKICSARCARISYNTHDGDFSIEKDLELYERLAGSSPKHLSPTEHVARVPYDTELDKFQSGYLYKGVGIYRYYRGEYVSNLNGWIQFRKLIEDDCCHGTSENCKCKTKKNGLNSNGSI